MTQLETLKVSEDRVNLWHGVSVPAFWVLMLRDEPGVPGSIYIRADYDPSLGRAVAGEVRVLREGAGDEVTSLTLREVRVQAALQVSGLGVSAVSEPDYPIVSGGDYLRRMRGRTDRNLVQNLMDAVTIYQLATAINLPPLRAVADGLGVSQSTATRLMNRARAEGTTPPVTSEPVVSRAMPRPHATGPVVGPPSSGGPSIGW